MGGLASLGVSAPFALAGAFAALSLASGAAARIVIRSTLVRLESQRAASGSASTERLTAFTPRLFSSENNRFSFNRSDVLGAPPRSTFQSFRVSVDGGASTRTFALFPVEPLWRSDDIDALRTLIYAQYFRKEEEGASSALRVAISAPELSKGIEGFGPFRPAIFADPHAEAARTARLLPPLPEGLSSAVAPVVLKDDSRLPAPLFSAHGTVWANFDVPPKSTVTDLRRADRRRGEGLPDDSPLPSVPKI
jgi:hypothetical protein